MATINGIEADWSAITLRLQGGELVEGFTSIKYSSSLEEAIVRANGRTQRGRTLGREKTEEGTLTVLVGTERAIIAALGGSGWCDRVFDAVVQYAVTGSPTSTDVLESFRFLGTDGGGEEGSDPLKRELKFSFLRLKRNGAYLTAAAR